MLIAERSANGSRIAGWLIGATLLAQLLLLPWTAHMYDVTAFLEIADRVFFAHTPPTKDWAFGSILLGVLLLSQLPILLSSALPYAMPLRIALLKLPFWLADIGTAYVIGSSASDKTRSNWWALRYLLDPAVLFVTVFHGQQDSLPGFVAVAAIALLIGDRYELASFALGIGAGIKFFPAAFAPLLCVVVLRRAGLRAALVNAGIFLITTIATLLPVFWGRFRSVGGEYTSNSFGQAGTHVSSSSLWSLLSPNLHLTPQLEQLVAVLLPLVIAVTELRHRPQTRDVTRAAMLTAMSIVLLNPGAHPPFLIWIAGPLVLYAAATGSGVVSLTGVVLSLAGVLLQFCQEGTGEYFLLNFGNGPAHDVFHCVGDRFLGAVTLACCIVIAGVSYVPPLSATLRRKLAYVGCAVAGLSFVALCTLIVIDVRASAAQRDRPYSFRREEGWLNTIAVTPFKKDDGSACTLFFNAGDSAFFAGNVYASQFVTANLGYSLYSPDALQVDGAFAPADALTSVYEDIDALSIQQSPLRITREFDVTAKLKPFRTLERMQERPCSLISNNPVLIYRFNMPAARKAAYERPFFERLNVFRRI